MAVGAGSADAYDAALRAPAGVANQGLARSDGMGSLGASRGSVQVQANDPAGTVLRPTLGATLTAQLICWNPLGYTTSGWLGPDWYVSTWYVSRWYRVSWYSNDWPGYRWSGSSWYGQANDSNTYGSPRVGSAWYGAWE